MCHWNRFGWEEVVGDVVEHLLGKSLHHRLGLGVQVPNHCVAVPATEELDEVKIHFAAQQGHGTASSKGSSADVFCWYASRVVVRSGSEFELVGDVFGANVAETIVAVVGGEWREASLAVCCVGGDTARVVSWLVWGSSVDGWIDRGRFSHCVRRSFGS